PPFRWRIGFQLPFPRSRLPASRSQLPSRPQKSLRTPLRSRVNCMTYWLSQGDRQNKEPNPQHLRIDFLLGLPAPEWHADDADPQICVHAAGDVKLKVCFFGYEGKDRGLPPAHAIIAILF